MKVAVIGAGSTYSPELVQGLLSHQDRLQIDELALHDIDEGRLKILGAFAGRILDKGGWRGNLTVTTDRPKALEGADFVILQLRVGGQAARRVDETLPLHYGCIGQETTGAGGFAKALRTVPLVIEIAEETAAWAADGAWLIDFTNPVGIVSQALLDAGHRAIGLCNVGIGLQRMMARHFGVEPERVQLEHVGLNHLSWERAVLLDGVNQLPQLLDERSDKIAAEIGLPPELVRLLAMIPSYYLRYYYMTHEVFREQKAGHIRADEVIAIEKKLLTMYKDPSLDEKPELLEKRGGAFYSEAAAQLMASLNDGTGDVQVVDVRNEGAIPNLAANAVVEIPARIDAEGPHQLSLDPLPPELLGLVQHVKSYEILTVEAALSGDREVALEALMTNPLVADYRIATPLLTSILEINRQYLPRFFPQD